MTALGSCVRLRRDLGDQLFRGDSAQIRDDARELRDHLFEDLFQIVSFTFGKVPRQFLAAGCSAGLGLKQGPGQTKTVSPPEQEFAHVAYQACRNVVGQEADFVDVRFIHRKRNLSEGFDQVSKHLRVKRFEVLRIDRAESPDALLQRRFEGLQLCADRARNIAAPLSFLEAFKPPVEAVDDHGTERKSEKRSEDCQPLRQGAAPKEAGFACWRKLDRTHREKLSKFTSSRIAGSEFHLRRA